MKHIQFYERIKGLREGRDLKQETMAEYLGITRQQYSLYETGKRTFSVEHIVKLCSFFRVSADYILGIPQGMRYGHSKTKGRDV